MQKRRSSFLARVLVNVKCLCVGLYSCVCPGELGSARGLSHNFHSALTTTWQGTVTDSVFLKLLYGQPEHKTKSSESPWTTQQVPYSANPQGTQIHNLRYQPNLVKTKEKGGIGRVTLGKCVVTWEHWLSTLVAHQNHLGPLKKSRCPGCAQDQLNQDLGEMELKHQDWF